MWFYIELCRNRFLWVNFNINSLNDRYMSRIWFQFCGNTQIAKTRSAKNFKWRRQTKFCFSHQSSIVPHLIFSATPSLTQAILSKIHRARKHSNTGLSFLISSFPFPLLISYLFFCDRYIVARRSSFSLPKLVSSPPSRISALSLSPQSCLRCSTMDFLQFSPLYLSSLGAQS